MLTVLATGTLTKDPQERTSATGKPYATALLRVPVGGEDAALVSLIAFNADAVRVLLALGKGDAVAVTGTAKLTSWEKDGEQKHGLSLVVERLLTPYQIEARRKASRAPVPQTSASSLSPQIRA